MKKAAVRAMIVLAAVVALSLFFSGTIRTLTTPKVRFLKPRQGKFEQSVELTGKAVFPKEENVLPDIPEGVAVTLTALRVQAGDYVQEGDPLFTASIQDLDKTIASLQKEYDTAQETLRTLQRKNGDIRLNRNEQSWIDAMKEATAANRAKRDCRIAYLSQLAREGLAAPQNGSLPENASEELKALYDSLRKAEAKSAEAEKKAASLNRYAVSDEIWSALKGIEEQQQKMKEAEEQIVTLTVLAHRLENYPAPHPGYITAISMEKGSAIDTVSPVLKITPEDSGAVLRAAITQEKLAVSKGASVEVIQDEWMSYSTKVTATGVASDASRYFDAAVTEDILEGFGSMKTLLKNDIKLRLTSKAKESSCLIPAAAVRGSGTERYVYTVLRESSTFGGTQLKVQKTAVTVLNESDTVVSVSEDLSYEQVVYQEDRPISEGSVVMGYSGEGGN